MRIFLNTLLFLSAFTGLKPANCKDRTIRMLTSQYSGYIYKVRPLLVLFDVVKKQKSLLREDKLDKDGTPILKTGQQISLYCSGFDNVLALDSSEHLKIDEQELPEKRRIWYGCPNERFLKSIFDSSRCLIPLLATTTANEKDTGRCAKRDKGSVVPIGFKLGKDLRFAELYSICFEDNDKQSAIYTSHQLFGSELLLSENFEFRNLQFNRVARVLKVFYLTSPYYTDTQEKTIGNIFGKRAPQYLSFKGETGTLFSAAPLTPPGDFYYESLKTATHLYENTVPVLVYLYIRDWHYIQIIGRLLALQVSSKLLKVYTGAFDLLTLPDEKNRPRSIYLDSRKSGDEKFKHRPIPKFLYKIFHDEKSKKGIAFVMINNPFFTFNVHKDFPCRHIGKDFVRMDYFSRDQVTRNTVYCRVDDLLNRVKDLPPIDVSAGHLYFNIYDRRILDALTQLPPGVPVF